MKTFTELKLPATLQESLKLMGFKEPTPIQAQAIPAVMEGHDLIGLAQTGTGKTAAFGIPMINHLIANRDASAIILVPTRELANQVCEVLKDLTRKNPEIRIVTIIGGMAMQGQLRQIQKGFRILVATPGRLVDHLQQRSGLLNRVNMVVMDEADRMLDMGFAPQLKQIYPHLPSKRQTLLFSATLPKEIEALAQKLLKDPVKVQVGQISVPVSKINQRAVRINGDMKNDRLLDEVNARQGSILVFVRTKRRTDKVAKFLKSYGLTVAVIHGNKSQGQRNLAIKGFKEETARILCATDIAARGIDISHVAHVINYDLPQVPEDYVHRIGRTARNGRDGESLSFISSDEVEQWRDIEKLLKQKGALPTVENAIAGSKTLRDGPADRQSGTGLKKPHRKGPRPGSNPVAVQPLKQPESRVADGAFVSKKKPLPKNIRFKHY
ncbi:MAG: DEAD/DEAH box helicase [Bdellovibrionales bacterium]|nr:DEAD/DEAH box helicase [Bdellovibrionales bacterium]